MKAIAIVVLLAACGGKQEPAGAQQQPQALTGETAPGGVPGTPDQCCCELPESRGLHLTTAAECAGQQGDCQPATGCQAIDEPSPMH